MRLTLEKRKNRKKEKGGRKSEERGPRCTNEESPHAQKISRGNIRGS